MTLQAGDKLMSLADVSEMLGIPVHRIEGTTIGDKRLSAVRASEIQAWVTDRAKVLSPTTVRLLVQTLRSVFNAAVQDRLIASSPVARLSLPRSERRGSCH